MNKVYYSDKVYRIVFDHIQYDVHNIVSDTNQAVKPIRSAYSAAQPITSSQSEWVKLIGSCGPISCQPATAPYNYQHTTKVCLHFSPNNTTKKSCTLSIS